MMISIFHATTYNKKIINLFANKINRCQILRHFSGSHENNVSSRLVILLDESFDLVAATDRHRNLQLSTSLLSILKHPKSSHIASKYSLYHYEHVDYNFNSVGEFELTLAAASGAYEVPNQQDNLHSHRVSQESFHSIIIIPEKVILHNLVERDIPFLFKNIFMSPSTLSVNGINELLKMSGTSQSAYASLLTDPTLLITVSSEFPISNSLRALRWFSEELQPSNNTIDSDASARKEPSRPVYVLVADSLGKHPQCTNVLALPADKCYENVSSVEIVRRIVSDLDLAIHT